MNQESAPDIGQVVGMIVLLVAMAFTLVNFFLSLRKASKVDHENKEHVDQKLLREVFGEFEEEEEEEVIAETKTYPPRPPTTSSSKKGWKRPEEKFVFHPSLDNFKQKTKIEDRKLDIHLRSGDELVSESLKEIGDIVPMSKKEEIHRTLKAFSSKKSFIIASEIIQPPVALRRRGQYRTYE